MWRWYQWRLPVTYLLRICVSNCWTLCDFRLLQVKGDPSTSFFCQIAVPGQLFGKPLKAMTSSSLYIKFQLWSKFLIYSISSVCVCIWNSRKWKEQELPSLSQGVGANPCAFTCQEEKEAATRLSETQQAGPFRFNFALQSQPLLRTRECNKICPKVGCDLGFMTPDSVPDSQNRRVCLLLPMASFLRHFLCSIFLLRAFLRTDASDMSSQQWFCCEHDCVCASLFPRVWTSLNCAIWAGGGSSDQSLPPTKTFSNPGEAWLDQSCVPSASGIQ